MKTQSTLELSDVKQIAAAAEAEALQKKLEAEASGNEQLGLATVHIKTADAEAVAKQGAAEASAIEARMQAEARGLKEKFDAMRTMAPETRAHEEYRMRVQNVHVETMKGIESQVAVAKEQAGVLSSALGHANIDIVGGQGDYFERFVNALAVGKGIDGAIARSDTLQVALKDHLTGERDMVGDLKELLGALGSSAPEMQNLGVSALIAKVMKDGSDEQRAALQKLINGGRK